MTPPGNLNLKLALPARLALASVRLEDECLSISATAAFENGQRGRSCTCDPSVPGRVRWLLRYALKTPAAHKRRSGETRDPTLEMVLREVRQNGAPGGTCTRTLPADNGLLSYSATGAKWWEALVMLQSSLPTVIFDTGFTDRQPDRLPLKLVAGVGVAPTCGSL